MGDSAEVMAARLEGRFDGFETSLKDVKSAVEKFVNRCPSPLCKEHTDLIKTMADLQKDLEIRLAKQEDIEANRKDSKKTWRDYAMNGVFIGLGALLSIIASLATGG
jgi:hypothetical protein